MASITINPVSITSNSITGNEQLIVINRGGKTSTISVNKILDLVDDDIVDRIDDQLTDQVIDQVTDQVNEMVDTRVDTAIDKVNNLKWTDINE